MPADRIPAALALSRLGHDRAGHHRTDEAWLEQAWPDARVLPVTAGGLAPVIDSELVTVTGRQAQELAGALPAQWPGRIFLGVTPHNPWFAIVLDDGAAPPTGSSWANLRDVGAQIDELDAGLFTSATALVAWHSRSGFCPTCGATTLPRHAGWTRRCSNGHDQFPRSDPAVIMLVHDGADRVVLGRQAVWPEGRFSILAGFVEAGEPIEAAVVREVAEEVGLQVSDVRYVASQPWPFPQSLMIGCTALANGDQIAPQDDEIAEAYWFTREEVAAAATWDQVGPDTPGIGPGGALQALPGPVSIARQLLDAWVAGEL